MSEYALEEALENARNGTPTLRPGQFVRTNLNDSEAALLP